MSISVNCPNCQEAFRWPDRRRGERVRCRKCNHSYVVDDGSPEQDRGGDGSRTGRRGGGSALLPVGICVYLVVVAIGLGVWVAARENPNGHPPGPVVRNPNQPGGGGNQQGGGGNQNIGNVDANALVQRAGNNAVPPWDRQAALDELLRRGDPRTAEAAVKMLADGSDRGKAQNVLRQIGPSARALVLTQMNHPDGGTRDAARQLLTESRTPRDQLVAQSLRDLDSPDGNRQLAGLGWFADTVPDGSQPKTAALALERFLSHADIRMRDQAVKGLRRWGTKDNTPAMVQHAERIKRDNALAEGHKWCVEALAEWKDPRGTPVLIGYLGHPFQNQTAYNALKAMGPTAQADLARAVVHPDGRVRDRVKQLLAESGTGTAILIDTAVGDLTSPNEPERIKAAEFLATTAVDEKRRAEVAGKLAPLLKERSNRSIDAGLKATKVWLHAESTLGLVALLESKQVNLHFQRVEALELLGKLKDPRAAKAIAKKLSVLQERGPAGVALKAIGPAAEDAVIDMLTDKDPFVRLEACRILETIGTEKCLAPLDKLTKDGLTGNSAKTAIDAVKKRKPGG